MTLVVVILNTNFLFFSPGKGLKRNLKSFDHHLPATLIILGQDFIELAKLHLRIAMEILQNTHYNTICS